MAYCTKAHTVAFISKPSVIIGFLLTVLCGSFSYTFIHHFSGRCISSCPQRWGFSRSVLKLRGGRKVAKQQRGHKVYYHSASWSASSLGPVVYAQGLIFPRIWNINWLEGPAPWWFQRFCQYSQKPFDTDEKGWTTCLPLCFCMFCSFCLECSPDLSLITLNHNSQVYFIGKT